MKEIYNFHVTQVNSTPYADFKPGIASSYVMEQVFGKLHVTTQQEIDDVMAQRRASLIDIPEGESATVVNYFRYRLSILSIQVREGRVLNIHVRG